MSINNSILMIANLRQNCHYKTIFTDFEPRAITDDKTISIIPKYNNDGQFWTKAFKNPYDDFLQLKYSETHQGATPQKQKNLFIQKIKNLEAEDNQQTIIFDPKDEHYCSVCYQSFESYWKHVNSQLHRRLIKSNLANDFIHELCSSFCSQKKMKRVQRQKKSTLSKKCGESSKKLQERRKKKKINNIKFELIEADQNYFAQDFIIKLPMQLWQKQNGKQNMNANVNNNFSTHIGSNTIKS